MSEPLYGRNPHMEALMDGVARRNTLWKKILDEAYRLMDSDIQWELLDQSWDEEGNNRE